MSEHLPPSPEKIRPAFTPEQRPFHEVVSTEKETPETREKSMLETQEKALREAKKAEVIIPDQETAPPEPQNTGLGRKQAYAATLKIIERQQSVPERVFSRFVHRRTVESVSETAGKSLARPKPLLWAGIGACISIGFFYAVASFYGYQMSGFEGIGGLIVGYALGLAFDVLTSKRSNH